MKLLSTTSVSKGLVTKSALVAAAVVIGFSSTFANFQRASADEFDDQIAALRQQMNAYQNQANELDAKATTLQAELDQITAQKNAILAQIDLSQKQYDQLQKQIEDTKQKIADNKDALGKIIADMYVDSSISPLEMLASSENVSDYVDKQAFRTSIQDSLSNTIEQINVLKKKLEASQKEVETVLEQQKSQKAQLAAKEAEQQAIVDQTRGDEAAYQQLANNAQNQMASAAAQQRAYYSALQAQTGGVGVDSGVVGSFVYANWSGNMGCGGDGYPYCGVQDSYADKWALLNRECVSYAAWRIDEVYGKTVLPFNRSGAPHGNAYEWPQWSNATRTYDPKPGDAVVLPAMAGFAPVGHLMVVESVSGDWVHVSQYNFYGSGQYSTMDIKKSGVIFLRFP